MKKRLSRILESFEDRRTIAVMGLLCVTYFLAYYLPETDSVIARILPLWPAKGLIIIAAATLVLQLMVWKALRHYYPRWYLNPKLILLLLCEFALALFTILLLSWPGFIVYKYFTTPHAH